MQSELHVAIIREFGKMLYSIDNHLSVSKAIYYAQPVGQHISTCFCIQLLHPFGFLS